MRNSPSPEPLRDCRAPLPSFGSCVLTYLYRLGVNTEDIFPSINGGCHILADFLGEPCCQLTTGIELSAANQVWHVFFALMVQTIKQIILAVNVERLSSYAKSDDFQTGNLRNNTTTWYISELIDAISGEILADSKDSNEICYEREFGITISNWATLQSGMNYRAASH